MRFERCRDAECDTRIVQQAKEAKDACANVDLLARQRTSSRTRRCASRYRRELSSLSTESLLKRLDELNDGSRRQRRWETKKSARRTLECSSFSLDIGLSSPASLSAHVKFL